MKSRPWRLIFLGTPQFAVPSLAALLKAGEEVLAVITQPDRPRGRGQKLSLSPVKELALSHRLPVLQPVRLNDPEFVAALKDLAPELMVATAYGRILTPEMLAIPSMGSLNVHASLLPRHRGTSIGPRSRDLVTLVSRRTSTVRLSAGQPSWRSRASPLPGLR